ncbi:MAG: hypothetical protein AB9880_05185 [Christensenellales bacterium]
MPRGVKGSGKSPVPQKTTVAKKAKAPEKKARKAYPSLDERIAMANKQAVRLSKLIASREALIEKSEATLNARKAALARNIALIEKVQSREQRLLARKDEPPKVKAPKLSPEDLKVRRVEALAKARAAKKAEKVKVDQLMAALKGSGKSVDDLLKVVKE